jgi:hypothetical protein
MGEKRDEVGNEGRSRELWDVPTEDAATLANQQERTGPEQSSASDR